MDYTPLFKFIIYHLLQSKLRSLVLFHCWDARAQYEFQVISAESYIFTKLINLRNPAVKLDNIENDFLQYKQPILGVFLDLNCPHSIEIVQECSRHRLYNAKYHWLLHDQPTMAANLTKIFGSLNLSVDTDVTYFGSNNGSEESRSYILYDVYNNGYQLGGKLNVTIDKEVRCSRSGCTVSRILSELSLRTKYSNRYSLRDITMRVSTVITGRPLTLPATDLENYLNSVNNTFIDSFARYGFQVLAVKKDILNCNFNINFVDRWSITETTGGVVGPLINEEADLSSSAFLPTFSRLKFFDVLSASAGFRSVCIFRTPQNSGTRTDVFLVPFSPTVWIFFGILLLITSILLWCIFHVEHYWLRCALNFIPSLLNTIIITIGSACAQGSSLIPLSTGGRMVFFTLSLITFIMYNYYTSIVVSSLLGSPIKSKIKTLGQLADSSLDVGLEATPFTFAYLNTSEQPDVRRFVKRKIEPKKRPELIWLPVEMGVKRVRDEPGFVYAFEASSGYVVLEKFYLPHEICDLNEVMLRPDKILYTQAHRNSSYKELIRLRETRMWETGIIGKFRRYWIRDSLNCFASNYVITVGMEYALPLFLFLICAYFVALFVLLLENLHQKYSRNKIQSTV